MFGIRNERLDRGHGSPYDRGSADSYYSRTKSPHYYKEGSYTSIKVCNFRAMLGTASKNIRASSIVISRT